MYSEECTVTAQGQLLYAVHFHSYPKKIELYSEECTVV